MPVRFGHLALTNKEGVLMTKQLFLPLNTLWYNLFKSGQKTWELRGITSRFNEDTITLGRKVEMRRGYSYDPLYGIIDCYIIVAKYDDLPEHVKIGIIPDSVKDDLDVIEFLTMYLEKYKDIGFIAFKIINLTNKLKY